MAERVGSKIRRILDHRGIKYTHFAQAMGIQPAVYSMIESGDRNPPPGYYEKAAEFFQLPIELVIPDEAKEIVA